LASDTLTLGSDGTFEQHVVLKDGRHFDATAQHWSYDPSPDSGHIALDKRLEFFTPEHTSTQVGHGVSTFEVLLVDVRSSEPTILLHPDSDCVYDKVHGK
jgi:hypothetical protein